MRITGHVTGKCLIAAFAVWAAALSAFPSAAQKSRAEFIDSLANPVTDSSGASMLFDSRCIDLGTIKEDGGAVSCRFRWKNAGKDTVTVVRIVTTCACAAPSYSSLPVAPGDTSGFVVKYYPKGHPGRIGRRIMVYTDRSGVRPACILELTGRVEPAVLPTWEYPVAFGPLLLRRKEVRIDGGKPQVERIMCLNAGKEPLTVAADENLLPPGFTVWCEPETVEAGGKADLYVRFRPEHASGRLPAKIPVILTGIPLPPSQRTITVLTDTNE